MTVRLGGSLPPTDEESREEKGEEKGEGKEEEESREEEWSRRERSRRERSRREWSRGEWSRRQFEDLWKTEPRFEAKGDGAWSYRTRDAEAAVGIDGRPRKGLLISAGLEEPKGAGEPCVAEELGHLDVRYYCTCGMNHLERDLDVLSRFRGFFIFRLEGLNFVGFCEPGLLRKIGRKCRSEPWGTRRLFREAERPCWPSEDRISSLVRDLSEKIEATRSHLGGCPLCGGEFRMTVRTKEKSVPLLEFLAERHGLQKVGAWWPRRRGPGCSHYDTEIASSYLTLESRMGLVDGTQAPGCDLLERELERSLRKLDEVQRGIEAFRETCGRQWRQFLAHRYGEKEFVEREVVPYRLPPAWKKMGRVPGIPEREWERMERMGRTPEIPERETREGTREETRETARWLR